MSEKVNDNVSVLTETLDRIKELRDTRELLEKMNGELEIHKKDLEALKTIKGEDSTEWKVKNEIVNTTNSEIGKLNEKITNLTFKKSELKPILDDLVKQFETALRNDQEREYHIEIGTVDETTGKTNGKRIFRELLEYVQKDVEWTAKTAPGLMMLDRNLVENKAWVQSKEFDGVIILRSANVLVLWKSVLEEMHGKGSFEAKKFLSCWANCGKAITDAVREINKQHETTREIGVNLNTVEDEFDKSIDDLPSDESTEMTTKEEVAPEV